MNGQALRMKLKKAGAMAAFVSVGIGASAGIAGAASNPTAPVGSAPTGDHASGSHVPNGHHHGPGGKVTGISAASVTVQGRSGASKTFTIDASTTYMKDGAAASASDVTVGSLIRIRPTAPGSMTAAVIMLGGHLGMPPIGSMPGQSGSAPQ